MPAAAMAGVSAVGGAGVASAKALAPVPEVCGLGGTIDFAKPGLSYAGSLTNKTTEEIKTDTTANAGNPVQCSTKAIKNKLISATDPCATTSPAAPICTTAPAKTLAKDPNFYDTAGSFSSAGTSTILNSLMGGISTKDNGTAILLLPTAASEVAGGACGTSVGFNLTGNVTGGNSSTNAFSLLVCLNSDTGTNTSGSFLTDLLGAEAGGNQVILTAGLDTTTSSLTVN